MLAYWLEKVRIEYNWSNSDVAERANLSRAAISSILNGHTSATAGTWASIARAVGANPLEFFIAEGWVYSADVATYVENADTRELQTLGVILEEIDPKHHQAFIKMVSAVADTLKIR